MKKLYLLFLLLALGLTATAQFHPYRDVVYLNDGSVIKGQIRFTEPDSTLFIDTQYGCTFVYTKDQVLRYGFNQKESFQREKGFLLRSSISAGLLTNYEKQTYMGADMSMGLLYRTSPWYEIGLNCSYVLCTPDLSMNSLAIQLAQRVYFLNKPLAPFLDFNVGFPIGDLTNLPESNDNYYWYDHSGGFIRKWILLESGVGVITRDIDIAICFSLSPYYTEVSHTVSEWGEKVFVIKDLFTISLRFGYSFSLN